MLDKNGDILLKPSPLKKKPPTQKATAPMGAEGGDPMATENAGMQEAVASQDGAAGGGEQVPMHGPESHAGMQGGAIGGRKKPWSMGGFGRGLQNMIAASRRRAGAGPKRHGMFGSSKWNAMMGGGGGAFGSGGMFFKEQSAFKMRSGNTTPFKLMGSSPAKQGPHFGIPKDEQTRKQKRETKQYHKTERKASKRKGTRWLTGRKKHTDDSGKVTITDKKGRIVKTKEGGVTTKYKKGSRPNAALGRMGKIMFNIGSKKAIK